MLGEGEVAGSQPMNTAVHRSPNKLWRSTVTPFLTYGGKGDKASSFCMLTGGRGRRKSIYLFFGKHQNYRRVKFVLSKDKKHNISLHCIVYNFTGCNKLFYRLF
jgi:hypothetical protein